MMGSFGSLAQVPHESLPYDDNMSFIEKVHNTFIASYEKIKRKYTYLPRQQELIDEYFSHLPGAIQK